VLTIDLKLESISSAYRDTWLQCLTRAEISELYVKAIILVLHYMHK